MGLFGIGARGAASAPISAGNLRTQAVNILANAPIGAILAANPVEPVSQPPTPPGTQTNNTSGTPISLVGSTLLIPAPKQERTGLLQQVYAVAERNSATFEKAIEIQEKKLIEDLKRTDNSPFIANVADTLNDSPIRELVQKREIDFVKKTYIKPRLTDQIFDDPSSIVNRPNVMAKVLSPKKILEKMTQYKRPPAPDSLKLPEIKFLNNSFQFVPRTGMSAFRPEIISLVNYEKIWSDGDYEPTGILMSFNYQSKLLRKMTLFNIMNNLQQNENTKDILARLIRNQDSFFSDIDSILSMFYGNIEHQQKIKNTFELSTLEDKAFAFLTLKTFFQKRMQYTADSYSEFSDTKILLQLLFDFRSVLENYSFNLLNTTDFDRVGDKNPINIDTTYTLSNNFNFTIESIKSSASTSRKATIPAEFTTFLNSLPPKPEDRIKLLIHLLSKEFRISKGLTKQSVRDKISNYYKGDPDGNPFDNIVGQVGRDIFDKVSGENSLGTLFQIPVSNGMVLPFENKTVDDGQTSYLPGTSYFIDTIFDLVNNQKFNLEPLETYSENFSSILSNAKFLIEEVFEKFEKSKLAPWPLYWKFIQTFLGGTENTGVNNPTPEQLGVLALLKAANKNNVLKTMLFQFYTLMSIALTTDTNRSKIVDKLINNLIDIRSLTYVKVDPNNLPELLFGLSELSPNLEQLADDIEQEVIKSLYGIAAKIKDGTISPRQIANKSFLKTDKTPARVLEDPSAKILLEPLDRIQQGNQNIILERGFIKRVLLSTKNTDGKSIPTLMNQMIQFHGFLDSEASIQGNDLSYIFDNNSTRFNFISISYLFLMNFELFSSFAQKFFDAEFVKSSGATSIKVEIAYNKAVNQEAILYLNQIITETPEPYKSLASQAAQEGSRIVNSLSTGNQSKVLSVNPRVITVTGNGSTKKNPFSFRKSTVDSNAEPEPNGQFADTLAAAASSLITTFQYQNPVSAQGNTRNPLLTERFGGANAFNSSYFNNNSVSGNTLGEQIRNQIPIGSIRDSVRTQIPQDALMFRQTNHVYTTLMEIKNKTVDEDVYVQNVLDIFDIIANRMSVCIAQSSFYFRELEKSSNFSKFIQYKDNIDQGHLKASSYINYSIRNSDTSTIQFVETPEQRNAVFQTDKNKFLSLMSLMRTDLFSKKLADSRTKILSIGIPAGFSSKLIDRLEKNEINTTTFKDTESDVVYVTVYKKSSEDQDIIFYPQRFMFDLSLYGLETGNIQVANSTDIVDIIKSVKLLDFTGKKDPVISSLTEAQANKKYSFLSKDQVNELFYNQVISELLKTYTYYCSGLQLTEEVFLENSYVPEIYSNIDNLPEETKNLLTAYFISKTGIRNATFSNVKNVLLSDSTSVPEAIKDDIRILVQGPVLLREDFVRKAILEKKKFEKVLFIPINIDSFVIDGPATRETSSGKRALGKQSFSERISVEKISNDDELIYFNRSEIANPLIFEDYFVTIQTVKKA
jgi:hypothetical protein